jgi:nucleotide-binding universal stress UspA family protein
MANETRMFKHILIPTDGTPLSEMAVRMGIDLAKRLGARATVFMASPDFQVFESESSSVTLSREQHAAEAERRANAVLAKGQKHAQDNGVQCDSVHVISDQPFEAIIAAVEKNQCDLVVMASHGRKGMAGVLLGSETTKVLTHSKVPVLVCR